MTKPKAQTMKRFDCVCGAEILFDDEAKMVLQEWAKLHRPHVTKAIWEGRVCVEKGAKP